ncbi:MAG: DUF6786 family protein [Bacteroidia bacterium]|nr:DUF6786 family protein [Bacteroidia bacterium]
MIPFFCFPLRRIVFFPLGIMAIFLSCNPSGESAAENQKAVPGTYAYDAEFLKKYQDVVELSDGNTFVLISTDFQGRVMTSSATGREGFSFGWINYDLIASPEKETHMNAFGGEDRFWLGPEGGQFSIYFSPGKTFEFENWYVPKSIDLEPFLRVSNTSSEAVFEKDIHLVNYSDKTFDLKVLRKIKLIDETDARERLDIESLKGIDFVAFESENQITNTGQNAWTRESGALSIWILGMLKPSPATTIVIPYKRQDLDKISQVVNDTYFGKVPPERLVIGDSVIFFRADGNYRSKIGLSPQHHTPYAGSYDAKERVLTVVFYSAPKGVFDYVNSMWELQESPFSGDVINAYNDGPLEGGGQLGPFYEIETSSPAAFLQPGQTMIHTHATFHFTGEESVLSQISEKVLGVSISEIKNALPN